MDDDKREKVHFISTHTLLAERDGIEKWLLTIHMNVSY